MWLRSYALWLHTVSGYAFSLYDTVIVNVQLLTEIILDTLPTHIWNTSLRNIRVFRMADVVLVFQEFPAAER